MDVAELRRKRVKLFDDNVPAAADSSKQVIDLTGDDDARPHPLLTTSKTFVDLTDEAESFPQRPRKKAKMDTNPPPPAIGSLALTPTLVVDDSPNAIVVRAFVLPQIGRKCSGCGNVAISCLDDVIDRLDEVFRQLMLTADKEPGVKHNPKSRAVEDVELSLRCGFCPHPICAACDQPAQSGLDCNTTASQVVRGLDIALHCAEEAMSMVWLLLCGIDSQIEPPASSNARPPARPFPKQGPKHGAHDTGVGYGSNHISYDDYIVAQSNAFTGAGHLLGDSASPKQVIPVPIQGRVRVATSPDTTVLATTLGALGFILPGLRSNQECRTTLVAMILMSDVLEKASGLLGTSSLEDVLEKNDLYMALFDFLRAVAEEPAFAAATLHVGRTITPVKMSMCKASMGLPSIPANSTGDDKYRSLATWMSSFRKSSDFVLLWAKKNDGAHKDKETKAKIALSKTIVALADVIDQSAPEYDVEALEAPASVDRFVWQRGLAMKEVGDELMFASNVYASDARNVTSLSPKRMKTLAKDLEVLYSSLPPNIFVRYGESRPDLMKILIVGPGESPYEHGLFEFDLFADDKYPLSPPKMTFRTTGCGTVHFNPNLYPNGYVCLSLLGTWQGPGWDPSHSTLLQIFVSIQAMIFCQDPWCNEPGRENMGNGVQSKNYNRTIQGLTVRHAMLEWLGIKSKLATPMYQSQWIEPPSVPDSPPGLPMTYSSSAPAAGAVPSKLNPTNAKFDHFLPQSTVPPPPAFWTDQPPPSDMAATEAAYKHYLAQEGLTLVHHSFTPSDQTSQPPSSTMPPNVNFNSAYSDLAEDQLIDLGPGPSMPEMLSKEATKLETKDTIPTKFPKGWTEQHTAPKPSKKKVPKEPAAATQGPLQSIHGFLHTSATHSEVPAPHSQALLVPQFQAPPLPHPPMPRVMPPPNLDFWVPVPELHFKAHADEILKTVHNWTQTKVPSVHRRHRQTAMLGPGHTLQEHDEQKESKREDQKAGAAAPAAPAVAATETPFQAKDLVKGLQSMLKTLEKGSSGRAAAVEYEEEWLDSMHEHEHEHDHDHDHGDNMDE